MSIRFVKISDAQAILDIYNYYVKNDTSTFDYQLASLSTIQQKINNLSIYYPYYVWEENSQVVAYAYAHPYYGREAYKWNVEVSIYLHHDYVNKGIGSKLYQALFKMLKKQGFVYAYACISGENEASIKMHLKNGFKQIGYFENAGYKFNRWVDVVWMSKSLNSANKKMQEPMPVTLLRKL